MHTRSRPAARIAAVTALLAAGAILVGCGPQAPPAPTESTATPSPTPAEPTPAEPSPTASATPVPSPTATTAPTEASGRVFETQNGTMRIPVPEGWTVHDGSRLGTDLSGRPSWENAIDFRAPSGTSLGYYDGFGAREGFINTDFGIVEQRPAEVGHGIVAMSWWVHASERYFVAAGLTQPSSIGAEPVTELTVPGAERNHRFLVLLLGDDQPFVATQAEAEQLLGSAGVVEALEMMAQIQLIPREASAMPPGVEP